MALSYSLIPLRCIPSLIPACARILKDEWRHCKTELLPQIVSQERTDVPCSLGLVEHHADTRYEDTLVGHVRLIPVVGKPTAVYVESMCIDKAKRSAGLGLKFQQLTDEYLSNRGYKQAYFATFGPHGKSDVKVSILPAVIGANLLRTFNEFAGWHGNTPAPGWEEEYKDGHIATKEELLKIDSFYMRNLSGSGTQAKL